jgi:hypothetical protein
MDIQAIRDGITAVAICGLIGWIAFLLTCIVIAMISKDGPEGLRAFGDAVKAYKRRLSLGGKKQDDE